jgi:hypothetical protein
MSDKNARLATAEESMQGFTTILESRNNVMGKSISPLDVQLNVNGRDLVFGLREWDEQEINMVVGVKIDEFTFDQDASYGFDRKYIVDSEQFSKERYVPWLNIQIEKFYGGFTPDTSAPLKWFEVHAKWFQDNFKFDIVNGFTLP